MADAETKPDGRIARQAASRQTPARVFLTADDLRARLAAGGREGGAVRLGAHERLTPQAMDLVASRGLSVCREEAAPARLAPAPRAGADSAFAPHPAALGAGADALGYIVSEADGKVAALLAAMQADGLAPVDCSTGSCPIENLRSLCQAVSAGRVEAGVAVLPWAADAMVLANKVRGVRAVQGTCVASVRAGARRFAANVLVLEHAPGTLYQMRSMVRAFAAGRKHAPTGGPLRAAIEALERQ